MSGTKRIYDPQGRGLPDCVKLEGGYDADHLRAELAAFADRCGAPLSAVRGRRVLPLYSIGGDPHRTDAGGPGLQDFSATKWLAHLPAVRKVLRALPGPPRSVRLVELPPGVRVTDLQSAKMGPPWGLCRVHMPITGGERVRAVFVDGNHAWQPGTPWFTASWRVHALVNQEPYAAVQLIVDLCYTPALGALFPAPFREMLSLSAALVRRPEVPLTPKRLRPYLCRFPMPETFVNWEQPGHHLPRGPHRGIVTAEIADHGGTPRLLLAGRPFCSLEHLGRGEFRMRGWSEERTLQVETSPYGPACPDGRTVGFGRRAQDLRSARSDLNSRTVVLRAREGSATYSTRLPAESTG
ncbi:hypothetical protein ABZ023_09735 [Streptomyces sp. NPDC006367]|uniref:hypothetical protein n=1 Tax=unclassified Streptomyces TaxID=2593676 RepID=UPI0033ABD551